MAGEALTPRSRSVLALGQQELGPAAARLDDSGLDFEGRTPSLLQAELASAGVDPSLGDHLGERYRVLRQLGRGGMGVVFLAVDEMLGKEVALKFVHLESAAGDEGLARLREEVLLAQEVTHVNVCRTYDLEEIGGTFIVKMEYVEGEGLGMRLEREGRLPIAEALRIAREVVAGLAAAHARGVIHCDLKPENTILASDGRVLLMDFGIARAAHRAKVGPERSGAPAVGRPATDEDSVELPAGTPEYMAPEQARGEPVDERADLYSLGCMLYHLVVGEVPLPASSALKVALRQIRDAPPDPRVHRPDLPPWLGRIILRLLDKDPSRRYPDAGAVLRALEGPRPLAWRRIALAAGLVVVVGVAVAAATHRLAPGREVVVAPPIWQPQISQALEAYEENADPPRVSFDGKWLAYTSNRDGSWRAYVTPTAGGAARAVSPPNLPVAAVRWTTDGQVLFFNPTDNRARKVAPTGGPVTVVAANVGPVEECGGRLLYFRRGTATCADCLAVVVRDAEGNPPAEREAGALPAARGVRNFRCDRSGAQLTYALVEPGGTTGQQRSDIYVLALDGGGARQLTTDHLSNDFPTFHPDGRSVIYTSSRDGATNVFEVSTAGGPSLRLTTEGQSVNGDVAPDGSALYVDSDVTAQPLVAHHLPTHARRRVTPTLDSISQPNATPDGRSVVALLLRKGRSHVALIPVDEGEERLLAEEGDAVGLTVDGTQVIYTIHDGRPERSHVLARGIDGTAPARELGVVEGRVLRIHCDAEGQVHLVVRGGDSPGAYRLPLAGGTPTLEAPPEIWAVLPAPRGGWRAAVLAPGQDGLLAVRIVPPGRPLDDPSAAVIPRGGFLVAWTRDGRSLYHWTGTEVRRHDVATGNQELALVETAFRGIAVSPDDKTIYIAENHGRARRQIVTNFAAHPRPVAAPVP